MRARKDFHPWPLPAADRGRTSRQWHPEDRRNHVWSMTVVATKASHPGSSNFSLGSFRKRRLLSSSAWSPELSVCHWRLVRQCGGPSAFRSPLLPADRVGTFPMNGGHWRTSRQCHPEKPSKTAFGHSRRLPQEQAVLQLSFSLGCFVKGPTIQKHLLRLQTRQAEQFAREP